MIVSITSLPQKATTWIQTLATSSIDTSKSLVSRGKANVVGIGLTFIQAIDDVEAKIDPPFTVFDKLKAPINAAITLIGPDAESSDGQKPNDKQVKAADPVDQTQVGSSRIIPEWRLVDFRRLVRQFLIRIGQISGVSESERGTLMHNVYSRLLYTLRSAHGDGKVYSGGGAMSTALGSGPDNQLAAFVLQFQARDSRLDLHNEQMFHRHMHYKVDLRLFDVTVKVKDQLRLNGDSKREEEETNSHDECAVRRSGLRIEQLTPAYAVQAFTPLSFPPSPKAQARVLNKFSSISADVVYRARDILRRQEQHSVNKQNKYQHQQHGEGDFLVCETPQPQLAIFDERRSHPEFTMSCGNHCATLRGAGEGAGRSQTKTTRQCKGGDSSSGSGGGNSSSGSGGGSGESPVYTAKALLSVQLETVVYWEVTVEQCTTSIGNHPSSAVERATATASNLLEPPEPSRPLVCIGLASDALPHTAMVGTHPDSIGLHSCGRLLHTRQARHFSRNDSSRYGGRKDDCGAGEDEMMTLVNEPAVISGSRSSTVINSTMDSADESYGKRHCLCGSPDDGGGDEGEGAMDSSGGTEGEQQQQQPVCPLTAQYGVSEMPSSLLVAVQGSRQVGESDSDIDVRSDDEPELSGKTAKKIAARKVGAGGRKRLAARVGATGKEGVEAAEADSQPSYSQSPFLLNWGDTVGVLMHIEPISSGTDSEDGTHGGSSGGDDREGEPTSCICTMHYSVEGDFLNTKHVFPISVSAPVFPTISVASPNTQLLCRFTQQDTLHHASVQQLRAPIGQQISGGGGSSKLQLHPRFLGHRIECLDGSALAK
jgi:hypothetical protein